MQSKETPDLLADTRLFQLVQKWFVTYPETPIPLDAWERKLKAYGVHRDDAEYFVELGQNSVQFFTPDMIPVLASISLGLGRDHLMGTIKHHGIKYENFSWLMVHDVLEPERKPLNEKLIELNQTNITRAMIEAFLLMPKFRNDIIKDIGQLRKHAEMDLLRSDIRELWRSTELDLFADEVYSNRPEIRNVRPELATFLTPGDKFSYKYLAREDVTLQEVRKIIRNAGHTNIHAKRDNLIDNRFFLNALLGASNGLPEFKKIADAINAATDPDEILEFSRAIIRSLSFLVEDGPSGEVIAEKTLRILDPEKYKSVVDSRVLRINLLEWPMLKEEAPSPYHILDEGSLFRELQQEIMSIRPESMEMHHFHSLRHFAKHWVKAHDPQGVDVDRLVAHIAKGLLSFQCKPRLPYLKSCHMDNEAITAKTELFLKFALKVKEPDYKLLDSLLDSTEKRLLCSVGYNIRNFTRMSNRDKGLVLSEELGL